jgi:predicted RNA-binding Zn-ribbon protein involved in translation (DUF1610 family)
VNTYKKNTWARHIRLQQEFWTNFHNPNKRIALWIGCIRVVADNLLSIRELPSDQLVGGLDSLWSAVRDSIVYTAIEMSLDNAIGALESHEVSLNGTNQSKIVAAALAKHFACSNCGKRGHRSSDCRKKNHGKTKAGATTNVKLGGYDSGSFDENEDIEPRRIYCRNQTRTFEIKNKRY